MEWVGHFYNRDVYCLLMVFIGHSILSRDDPTYKWLSCPCRRMQAQLARLHIAQPNLDYHITNQGAELGIIASAKHMILGQFLRQNY